MIENEIISKTLAEKGYILQEEIGHGQHAIVFKVLSQKYNIEFAAKVFSLNNEKNSHLKNIFNAEKFALLNIIHPNVILIYDYFIDNNHFYLILEYCPNGTLMNFIEKKTFKTKEKLIFYFKEMLEALKFIHSKNIAHLDIKPANILFDKYFRLKISDFGLASNFEKNELIRGFLGSLLFMSPEQIKRQNYDPFKADIWALGITFYLLATNENPWNFSNKIELENSISLGLINFPNNLDLEIKSLILEMLNMNFKKRKTTDELLNLPIFKNILKHNSDNLIKNKKIPELLRPQIAQNNSFGTKVKLKSISVNPNFYRNSTFSNLI